MAESVNESRTGLGVVCLAGMELQHGALVATPEGVANGVADRPELAAFSVDFQGSEGGRLVVLRQATIWKISCSSGKFYSDGQRIAARWRADC